MTKSLIAYYSRRGENFVGGSIVDLSVGNTEVTAMLIHRATGADLLELETAQSYPADYHACTDVAKRELREGARPSLIGLPADLAEYDTVFLGYPNWWGTFPMPVFTFLETFDFAGKMIVPFCTHEGSGLGRSERDIRAMCPDAEVVDGLAIIGSRVRSADEQIRDWIATSGIAMRA